jgi:hypothetical protein
VGNLIEDEQSAMSVASPPNGLPVIGPGNVGSAADWFSDHGCDIALFLQYVLDVVGTLQIAASPLVAIPQTAVLFWRRDVLSSGKQRTDVLTE